MLDSLPVQLNLLTNSHIHTYDVNVCLWCTINLLPYQILYFCAVKGSWETPADHTNSTQKELAH